MLTEEATYRYALERIKEASFPLDQIMLVPKHGDISTLRKLNTHFLTDCQVTENSAEDTWIQKEGQDISWDFNCQDTRHHVFSQSNVIELESDHGTTQTLQSHFSFDTAQESMVRATLHSVVMSTFDALKVGRATNPYQQQAASPYLKQYHSGWTVDNGAVSAVANRCGWLSLA